MTEQNLQTHIEEVDKIAGSDAVPDSKAFQLNYLGCDIVNMVLLGELTQEEADRLHEKIRTATSGVYGKIANSTI